MNGFGFVDSLFRRVYPLETSSGTEYQRLYQFMSWRLHDLENERRSSVFFFTLSDHLLAFSISFYGCLWYYARMAINRMEKTPDGQDPRSTKPIRTLRMDMVREWMFWAVAWVLLAVTQVVYQPIHIIPACRHSPLLFVHRWVLVFVYRLPLWLNMCFSIMEVDHLLETERILHYRHLRSSWCPFIIARCLPILVKPVELNCTDCATNYMFRFI